MVCEKSVYHSSHSHERKQARTNLSDSVAKVQEADGETTEDDGKVEPREECTFIGKENLGLDADWEGYALSWQRIRLGTLKLNSDDGVPGADCSNGWLDIMRGYL